MVEEQGGGVCVAHLFVLRQDPFEIFFRDGSGEHAPHQRGVLGRHVGGQVIDPARGEDGGELSCLGVGPLRVPHHVWRLIDEDELGDAVAGVGVLIPPRPGDGASHRVSDDGHVVEAELAQDIVQVGSKAGDAVAELGLIGVAVAAVVKRGDVEAGRGEVLYLLAPFRSRLAPPGKEK